MILKDSERPFISEHVEIFNFGAPDYDDMFKSAAKMSISLCYVLVVVLV